MSERQVYDTDRSINLQQGFMQADPYAKPMRYIGRQPRISTPSTLNSALYLHHAPGAAPLEDFMQDLIWIGITVGLTLLTFAYFDLCDRT